MSLSYRNQSTDLQSKATDWFLYERVTGRYRLKVYNPIILKPFNLFSLLKPNNCYFNPFYATGHVTGQYLLIQSQQ